MGTLSPRATAKYVTQRAKHVKVNDDGVDKVVQWVVDGLRNKTFNIDGFLQNELHPNEADDGAIEYIFVVDALNFCFWFRSDETKWNVEWNGKGHTGYFALCAAMKRALAEGIPITDAKFYSEITVEQMKNILRSDSGVEAPLMEERVANLREVGRVLLDKYDGRFAECVSRSNRSAQDLLKLVVSDFPCFRDVAEYDGEKIAFYKRAQILIADVWACFRGEGKGRFDDIDSLTIFADYRVPQALVYFGAMEYSDKLMQELKKEKELKNGSPEEVEIRAASMWAVEKAVERTKKIVDADPVLRGTRVNAVLIDYFLWDYRRQMAAQLEHVPFHQVRCIYY